MCGVRTTLGIVRKGSAGRRLTEHHHTRLTIPASLGAVCRWRAAAGPPPRRLFYNCFSSFTGGSSFFHLSAEVLAFTLLAISESLQSPFQVSVFLGIAFPPN